MKPKRPDQYNPAMDEIAQANSADVYKPEIDTREIAGLQTASFTEIGGRREQQDALAMESVEIQGNLVCVAAVADGHNPEGDIAATSSIDAFIEFIEMSQTIDFSDNDLRKFCKEMDEDIEISLEEGGTTFSGAVITPKDIIYLQVGDSSAGLIHIDGSVRMFAEPHRPTIGKEYERIYKNGGFYDSDVYSQSYVRDDTGDRGLAVSRSLGDKGFSQVLSEPSIVRISRDNAQAFFVVATDGFWDYFENRDKEIDSAELALETTTISAEGVMQEYIRRYKESLRLDKEKFDLTNTKSKSDQFKYREDNISIVVVQLHGDNE